MERKIQPVTAVILVVTLILSAASTYIVLNTTHLQNQRIEGLSVESEESQGRLEELELAVGGFTQELDDLTATREQLQYLLDKLVEIKGLMNNSMGDIDVIQSDIDELVVNLSAVSSYLTGVEEGIVGLQEDLSSHLNQTPARVYETVRKSVVIIRTDDKQGSGFVWMDEGYILTNWHVVNETSTVNVEFHDGTRVQGTVIGLDAYSDVAVLNISGGPRDAVPLELGNSSEIWVGQEIVAIGNPLGVSGSLSSGFISQVNEKLDLPPLIVPVLQLDLSVAPGSSGGPLLDLKGNVLGITNAGTFFGFNFAVPSNMVRRVATSIVEKGYFRHPLVGFWGVLLTPETIEDYNVVNINPYQNGILV
ncbi:MAG: trypsin-like peptidase domain-containing protein, partial [Candidatus Bathyarchaeota archaeon]